MADTSYRICKRCVMDTSDREIRFDVEGNCHHCATMGRLLEGLPRGKERSRKLEQQVERMRKDGRGKDYDCLMGVSGGVDSTYVAYLLKQYGLRPLAIHLDNGWNSELAVGNIKKVLDKCGVDLVTHVIDWEEFKDLQLSFLKASIPGMEIPTDHAIVATLFAASQKYRIRYFISGSNVATEGVMPPAWSEARGQHDWLLIKNVHKRFGSKKLRTFPHLARWQRFYHKLALRQFTFNVLDYVGYEKNNAIKLLQDEFDWVYYGGKHYESIYTRFTQGYIQPKKFRFDKRRAHLSALVVSGEITRDAALEELSKSPYPNSKLLNEDLEIFKKKLALSDSDFDEIMAAPAKTYLDYPGYTNSGFHQMVYGRALQVHFALKARGYYGRQD